MKHALILVATFCCFAFTDAPSFSASIHDSGDASFTLVVENPRKERLHLSVVHTQFGLVSDTTITSSKLRCKYNLQTVDDGEYTVEVTNGKDHVVKRFSMQTETKIERKINIAAEPAKSAF
jgi:hypothetical protein